MTFNIENFPDNPISKRMLDRISPIYDKSYIGKWLFEVMGMEMQEARQLVEELRIQCYLDKATWGIRYWEERYGIQPDDTKSIEERRTAVKAKRGKKQPLSPAALEEILELLTGRKVDIAENNANYSFNVSIPAGTSKVDYNATIQKLNTVKPSHLAYKISLPRKGELTVFFAAAMYEVKQIIITEYDDRGVSDVVWLVDENGNTLADENMNVFVD